MDQYGSTNPFEPRIRVASVRVMAPCQGVGKMNKAWHGPCSLVVWHRYKIFTLHGILNIS